MGGFPPRPQPKSDKELLLLNCWKVGGVKMKLLIKIGLVIDLVILIASFILGNFVYTAFELHKFIELIIIIAFILLIYSLPMNYATYKIEKANNEKSKEICRGLNYVNLIIVAIVNLIFLILGFSEFSKVAFYLTVFATVLLENLIRVYIFYARSWNR